MHIWCLIEVKLMNPYYFISFPNRLSVLLDPQSPGRSATMRFNKQDLTVAVECERIRSLHLSCQ